MGFQSAMLRHVAIERPGQLFFWSRDHLATMAAQSLRATGAAVESEFVAVFNSEMKHRHGSLGGLLDDKTKNWEDKLTGKNDPKIPQQAKHVSFDFETGHFGSYDETQFMTYPYHRPIRCTSALPPTAPIRIRSKKRSRQP